MPKPKQLRMDQICTGEFETNNGGRSYMIIGLSEDGIVYRYEKGRGGWLELNMECVGKAPDAAQTPAKNYPRSGTGYDPAARIADDIPF